MSNNEKKQARNGLEFGLALIVIGCGILAYKLGFLYITMHWWVLLFAFTIIFGTIRIVAGHSLSRRVSGVFQIFFGATIYAMFEHLWGLNFFTHWPIILVIFGIGHISQYLIKSIQDKTTSN